MSELHTNPTSEPATLGVLNRLGLIASIAIAGVLFLSVGWKALEPDDPLGAVSVLAHRNGAMLLLYAAGLCLVVAAVATTLVGRRLIDAGVFVASVGLAFASLKGGTVETLLLARAGTSAQYEQILAWQFALESVGWLGVLFVGLLTSGFITHWLKDQRADQAGEPGSHMPTWAVPALFDLPQGIGRRFGVPAKYETSPLEGAKHMAVVAGVGLLAMALFSAGRSTRAIESGQVCFVVAAAFFVAVYIGDRFAPVRSALWALMGVGLAAVVAYTWAALRSPEAMGLPSVPASHYLRVLPIQFIAVGWASALVAFWYGGGPLTSIPPRSRSLQRQEHR